MDPIQPDSMPDSISLEVEILDNAFRLNFGTEQERIQAIQTLAHLINVLEHSYLLEQTKET